MDIPAAPSSPDPLWSPNDGIMAMLHNASHDDELVPWPGTTTTTWDPEVFPRAALALNLKERLEMMDDDYLTPEKIRNIIAIVCQQLTLKEVMHLDCLMTLYLTDESDSFEEIGMMFTEVLRSYFTHRTPLEGTVLLKFGDPLLP